MLENVLGPHEKYSRFLFWNYLCSNSDISNETFKPRSECLNPAQLSAPWTLQSVIAIGAQEAAGCATLALVIVPQRFHLVIVLAWYCRRR